MAKKLLKTSALLLAIVVCLAALAACGGGTKATEENVKKIDNTMDLAAVEAIIGKATHDLRGGALSGRVAWNISFQTKTTQTHVYVFIDFDANGKVEQLEAYSDSAPAEGGSVVRDWHVRYPAP